MPKLRDALTAVADRIGEALTRGLFPEAAEDERRVVDIGATPPRKGSPRREAQPPMEYVMPRMGYRYHLSWTPPEGILRRWWRKATGHEATTSTRASP